MLNETGAQLETPLRSQGLGLPERPVRFFEIPPRAHAAVGKLIVPYVHLTSTGHLDETEPVVYGVTARPNILNNRPGQQEVRTREVHVYTEHLALQRGIRTPYGRASAEAIGARLVPEVFVRDYALDRIAHLEALQVEVDEARLPNNVAKEIGGQLLAGMNTLEEYVK